METERLLICLIIVILLLVATLIVFLWQSGLFLTIDVKTCKPPFASLEIAYKYHKKLFENCGALFTEAHSINPKLRCIGVYYDDPFLKSAPQKPIRYLIGVILPSEAENLESTKSELTKNGYNVVKFPEVEYVIHATFSNTSILSVPIATRKVFPAFQRYIKDRKLNAHPILEIFEDNEILYSAPLSKHDEFYVPELLIDSEEDLTSDPRTADSDDNSTREIEDFPNTASSIDSLLASDDKELPPSVELITTFSENENENDLKNESDGSTESFEELQLDS